MSASVLFDAPGPRAKRRSRIASAIVIVVVLAGLAWIVYTLAQPRESGGITLPGYFDWTRWEKLVTDPEFWGAVGRGVLGTLQAAAIAAVGAIAIGVLFALLRTSPLAVVRVPTTILLEFFRGMPVLLMMLFILLVGSTGAFWAVVIALAVYNGALIGEALRAGIVSLPRGQREAGLSLGLTRLQTKLQIEFPQAFRQMLPIIVAQLVVLLKDTSLGYIVGYNELIRTTMNNLSSFYGNRYLFTLFLITLVIYLAINLTLSWVARRLARRRSQKVAAVLLDGGAQGGRAMPGPLAAANGNPENAATE
ncbi:amino acid ABC transporter permease [Herbiconiux sp. VKM Ac-2851]|uniref:amino acid ABC transporter permease n=1 Tax=Herbiconiux sp. VKM Ac-2851 TaxID=2739025 RepID=UPI0015649C80|nr:amino acid ABC transporter permease [Herbiconiux sp. VKM Ac-2851]NQX36715.1 amino acid ABC transporter permease [Herbiconiux sp. VKM Ac-2851]